MTLTFPKWGLGSPPGLPKTQNSITGVKTPRLEVFFIPLEKFLKRRCRKWPRMNHSNIYSTSYVWKKGSGIKVTVWLPTIKSYESTRFPYVKATCEISLKSSWRGLQLCFRPHCNRRSSQKVMRPQSCESPNYCNFGTPTWDSRDKKPFGCGPYGVTQSIPYEGRWWLPPSLGRGESSESRVARGLS
jgi:hypothetical protein